MSGEMEVEFVRQRLEEMLREYCDKAMSDESAILISGAVLIDAQLPDGERRFVSLSSDAAGRSLAPWAAAGLMEYGKDFEINSEETDGDDDDER